MTRAFHVEAFGITWFCHADVDDDSAFLVEAKAGLQGASMPAHMLNPRVVKVLEADCWAAAQTGAA